jgi:tetratricopeptide (TPR) repeat protein
VLRDFYASRQTARGRIERHERAAEYYTLRRSRAGDLVEEVHHLLAAGETDSAAIALAAGGQGILVHGHVEEVLSLAARIPSDWKNSEQAFDLAFLRGTALDILGRWPEARAEYERCIGLAEEMEDAERKAETLRRLGAIEYRQGGPHAALALFEEALALAATEQTKAELHGSIGVVRWKLGEFEAAKQSHERDLELSRTLESPRGISRALNNLGILDWQAGNHLAALDRYSEALRQAEIIPDRRLIAAIYSNIGDAHRALGRPEEARRYYERCLELAEDLKFNWQVAEACRGLAEVVTERRKHYLSRALSIFERLGAAGDAKTVREMMP